ncbi:hypothetical protein HK102_003078 [Quaeritorhiza haematococci]|nr:hypothetical protein HK102_003078 [Quaeritorhiza haematococci]
MINRIRSRLYRWEKKAEKWRLDDPSVQRFLDLYGPTVLDKIEEAAINRIRRSNISTDCTAEARTAMITDHARSLDLVSPVDVQLVAAVDEMTIGSEMSVTFDYRTGKIRGAADIPHVETCWSPDSQLKMIEADMHKKIRNMKKRYSKYLADGDKGFDLGGPKARGMMKILEKLRKEVFDEWLVLGEAITKEEGNLEKMKTRVKTSVDKRKQAGNHTAVETPNQAKVKSVLESRISVMKFRHLATLKSLQWAERAWCTMKADVWRNEAEESRYDPYMRNSIDLFEKTTIAAITLALRTLVKSFIECRLAVLLRATYLQSIVMTDTLNSKSMVYAFFAIHSAKDENTRKMLQYATEDFAKNHAVPVISWVSDGASAGLGHSVHGDYYNTYLSLVRAAKEEFRTTLQNAGRAARMKAGASADLVLKLARDYLSQEGSTASSSGSVDHERLWAWLERNLLVQDPGMVSKRKRDLDEVVALKEQRKRARNEARRRMLQTVEENDLVGEDGELVGLQEAVDLEASAGSAEDDLLMMAMEVAAELEGMAGSASDEGNAGCTETEKTGIQMSPSNSLAVSTAPPDPSNSPQEQVVLQESSSEPKLEPDNISKWGTFQYGEKRVISDKAFGKVKSQIMASYNLATVWWDPEVNIEDPKTVSKALREWTKASLEPLRLEERLVKEMKKLNRNCNMSIMDTIRLKSQQKPIPFCEQDIEHMDEDDDDDLDLDSIPDAGSSRRTTEDQPQDDADQRKEERRETWFESQADELRARAEIATEMKNNRAINAQLRNLHRVARHAAAFGERLQFEYRRQTYRSMVSEWAPSASPTRVEFVVDYLMLKDISRSPLISNDDLLSQQLYLPAANRDLPTFPLLHFHDIHHVVKNLVKNFLINGFAGLRPEAWKELTEKFPEILPLNWWKRDPQDVESTKKFWDTLVTGKIREMGYVDEADFAVMIGQLYDAFDTKGYSDEERLAIVRRTKEFLLQKVGHLLRDPRTTTMTHFLGLCSQSVWAVIMNTTGLEFLLTFLPTLPKNAQAKGTSIDGEESNSNSPSHTQQSPDVPSPLLSLDHSAVSSSENQPNNSLTPTLSNINGVTRNQQSNTQGRSTATSPADRRANLANKETYAGLEGSIVTGDRQGRNDKMNVEDMRSCLKKIFIHQRYKNMPDSERGFSIARQADGALYRDKTTEKNLSSWSEPDELKVVKRHERKGLKDKCLKIDPTLPVGNTPRQFSKNKGQMMYLTPTSSPAKPVTPSGPPKSNRAPRKVLRPAN